MSENQELKKIPDGYSTEIIVWHGDITTLGLDAIVNATDEQFSGGSGVDAAIHRAAGTKLEEECKEIKDFHTGGAVITKGYKLPAKHLIHTIGPKYGSENGMEDVLLANCYRNCLRLAFEHNLRTIAFPNISTGIYRYPKEEATEIAFNTVWEWVRSHKFYNFEKIYFVSYTEEDFGLNEFFFRQFEFV